MLHYAYNVTLNGNEFEITEEGIKKMVEDGDCLIENCYDYDDKLKTLIKKIVRHLGSVTDLPLVKFFNFLIF